MVDFIRLLVEEMAEISSLACVDMLGGKATETSTASYDVNFFSASAHDALPLAITVIAFAGMGAVLLIKGLTDTDDDSAQSSDRRSV